MAKFRSNHQKTSPAKSGMTTKVGIFVGLVYLLYQAFQFFVGNTDQATTSDSTAENTEQMHDLDLLMPKGKNNQLVRHEFYALNYNETYEVADWIVYEMDRASLNVPNVARTDDFRIDKKVHSGSATIWDYKRSGYDRGHQVPAGDMAFSKAAMSATFLMSNIAPQVHQFNGGIWRELEENVRDWARKFRHIYITTGPLLSQEPVDYIGDNDVAVPAAFYKVILDLSEPELKGIAFVIPNKISYQPLADYAVSMDKAEEITGLDFFPDLMEDDIEAEIESKLDLSAWNISKKRFELRKERWNKY